MARAYEGARKARERKPLEGLPRLLAVSGGADIGGLIAYLVAALMPLLDRAYLDAVVGPHGTALTAVDGVTIHDAPECLDNLLGAAGVYVGAAGTTAVQAAAVGVAQVILPLVDNQVAQAAALEHAGAAIAIERRDADLAKVATKMADATALILGDAARMREMGMNGARLVDGLGAARVAEAVRRLATLGAVA
jgi:spore coat polysaccharide biosynthesis predicted glycosyltransferase SpsG